MSHYPEPNSHIRDKVKVVLELSDYAAKKEELNDATGVNTSHLAVKNDFIALKDKPDKLDIKKLVNVPTGLNNLKTKVDGLDVGKLKNVWIDLKKPSDVISKEVVKKTVYYKLSIKVNDLDKNSWRNYFASK